MFCCGLIVLCTTPACFSTFLSTYYRPYSSWNFNILVYLGVSNIKNRLLQNNLLSSVICWTNSHLNTAAVAGNSITFLGWKSIEIYENNDTTNFDLLSQHCTSTFLCEQTFIKKYWWFDWWSMIAIIASFRQDFKLKKWVFVHEDQMNDS